MSDKRRLLTPLLDLLNPCKRRRVETLEDVQEGYKRQKVSISLPDHRPKVSPVYTPPTPIPEDPFQAYQSLVSEREDASPSLLSWKLKLLKTVIRKGEETIRNTSKEARSTGGSEDVGQPSPEDRILKNQGVEYRMTDMEEHEVDLYRLFSALTASDPHSQYGVSGIRVKDAKTLTQGQWTSDEVINDYARILTRDANFPVANSYFFELLKDMFRVKCYDVGKVVGMMRLAGVDPECGKMAVPVCWNDCHWSCAVVDRGNGSIHYYDSQGTMHASEVFTTLHYFLESQYEDPRSATESSEETPRIPPEDSGPGTLFLLRCLALNHPTIWSDESIPRIRRLLALEIKRGCVLSPNMP